MIQRRVYAAVRLSEGREWVDISTIRLEPVEAKASAREVDQRIPHWAQANPVVRVGPFDIQEIQLRLSA